MPGARPLIPHKWRVSYLFCAEFFLPGEENQKLKKIAADLMLENFILID
jgi:hypothetical protein